MTRPNNSSCLIQSAFLAVRDGEQQGEIASEERQQAHRGQGDATDLAQEAQARKRSAAINEAHEKERRDMHKVRPQLHPATCKQLMT